MSNPSATQGKPHRLKRCMLGIFVTFVVGGGSLVAFKVDHLNIHVPCLPVLSSQTVCQGEPPGGAGIPAQIRRSGLRPSMAVRRCTPR